MTFSPIGGISNAWSLRPVDAPDQHPSGEIRATPGLCAYAETMFFLFGFGSKKEHLGAGATRTCPNCHNTSQWSRVREFKQLSVFFIPVARWGRKQFEACGICGVTVAA